MKDILLGGYGLIAMYFGWKLLDKMQASLGLTFLVSDAIYFIVAKAILAVIVGIFTTPFYIAYMIFKAVSSSKGESANDETPKSE